MRLEIRFDGLDCLRPLGGSFGRLLPRLLVSSPVISISFEPVPVGSEVGPDRSRRIGNCR